MVTQDFAMTLCSYVPLLMFLSLPAAAHGQAPLPASLKAREVVVPPRGANIPLQVLPGSRAAIRMMVNGHGPYLFAVETGSAIVVVTARVAAEAGLRTSPLGLPPELGPPPEGGQHRLVTIDSLQAGRMILRELPAAVGPDLLPGVEGFLGLAAYADLLLTLDYPSAIARFTADTLPLPNGRDILPLTTIDLLWSVPLEIDGVIHNAVLDTQGGLGLGGPPAIAEGFAYLAPLVPAGQVRIGGAPPVVTRGGRLRGDAHLGGYTLEHPIIMVSPVPAGVPGQLVLGTELLRNFVVALDQRSRRVRFTRRDLHVPPPPPLRAIGLATGLQASGRMTVVAVVAGGAADAAGIRAGDEVLEIAGRAPAFLQTPGALQLLLGTGQPLHFKLRREGEMLELDVVPKTLVP